MVYFNIVVIMWDLCIVVYVGVYIIVLCILLFFFVISVNEKINKYVVCSFLL